jgi:hypothetical protein
MVNFEILLDPGIRPLDIFTHVAFRSILGIYGRHESSSLVKSMVDFWLQSLQQCLQNFCQNSTGLEPSMCKKCGAQNGLRAYV